MVLKEGDKGSRRQAGGGLATALAISVKGRFALVSKSGDQATA
jgi:hypothetical protein